MNIILLSYLKGCSNKIFQEKNKKKVSWRSKYINISLNFSGLNDCGNSNELIKFLSMSKYVKKCTVSLKIN